MKTVHLIMIKFEENIRKRFYQFVFGRDRFLELPLKKRLLISYLGAYNLAN
jgi:hypothetical protein